MMKVKASVGVMGKGIALEFKKRYPEMFEAYRDLCEKDSLNVGDVALWKGESKWVLMFPTKKHWRSPSKIEYIEEGLKKFSNVWDKLNIDSIAFPKLGCGNGGLSWADVKPLMERYLKKLPINIYIYVDYYENPRDKAGQDTEIEKWISGRAGLNGYALLRSELINSLVKNNQGGNSSIANVDENNDIFLDGEKVDDLQLALLWSIVESSGIIGMDEAKNYAHMQTLLKLMNDVNRTKLIYAAKDEKFPLHPNAYQYVNEG